MYIFKLDHNFSDEFSDTIFPCCLFGNHCSSVRYEGYYQSSIINLTIHPLPPRSHNPGESWDRCPESRGTLQQWRHRWERLLRAGREWLSFKRHINPDLCSIQYCKRLVWSKRNSSLFCVLKLHIFILCCTVSDIFIRCRCNLYFFLCFSWINLLPTIHIHVSTSKAHSVLGQHSVFLVINQCDHVFYMSFKCISWLN